MPHVQHGTFTSSWLNRSYHCFLSLSRTTCGTHFSAFPFRKLPDFSRYGEARATRLFSLIQPILAVACRWRSSLAITPLMISLLWAQKTIMHVFPAFQSYFSCIFAKLVCDPFGQNTRIFGSEAKWNRFQKVHFENFGLPLHTVIFFKKIRMTRN